MTDIKQSNLIVYIWLIVLSIISISALCRSFYSPVGLELDYAGILIGLLAALATILIGWQIVNLMDIKSQKNDISKLKEQIKEELTNLTTDFEGKITTEETNSKCNMAFLGLIIMKYQRKDFVYIMGKSIKEIISSKSTEFTRDLSYAALSGVLPKVAKK